MIALKPILQQLVQESSYSAKLRTPEWDNRRKAFLNSHGLFCESCKQGGKTLQVHHRFYRSDRAIDEYADHELTVLCSECHHQIHEAMNYFRSKIASDLNASMLSALVTQLAASIDKNGVLFVIMKLRDSVENPSE